MLSDESSSSLSEDESRGEPKDSSSDSDFNGTVNSDSWASSNGGTFHSNIEFLCSSNDEDEEEDQDDEYSSLADLDMKEVKVRHDKYKEGVVNEEDGSDDEADDSVGDDKWCLKHGTPALGTYHSKKNAPLKKKNVQQNKY